MFLFFDSCWPFGLYSPSTSVTIFFKLCQLIALVKKFPTINNFFLDSNIGNHTFKLIKNLKKKSFFFGRKLFSRFISKHTFVKNVPKGGVRPGPFQKRPGLYQQYILGFPNFQIDISLRYSMNEHPEWKVNQILIIQLLPHCYIFICWIYQFVK